MKISSGISLLLLLTSASTTALEITVERGYDSNPYELSNPKTSGWYNNTRVNHRGIKELANKNEIQYGLKANVYRYDSSVKYGDEHRIDGRLRYLNRFKLNDKSSSFMLTADATSERQSNFSQALRDVYTTSRGDILEDKYSYDSIRLTPEFIYRFNRRHSIGLSGYLEHRDYTTDYDDLDYVDSLDYNEMNIQPTYRYKSSQGFYLRGFVYHRQRDYVELSNSGSNGRRIPDSVMSYTLDGYGLYMAKPLTDNLTVKSYFKGYFARDNAEGYRDLDFHQAELGLSYDHSYGRLDLSGHCYSRDYLQDNARAPLSPTGTRDRKLTGCYAELLNRSSFLLGDFPKLQWLVRLTTENEEHSDDILSYQRQRSALGLEYTF